MPSSRGPGSPPSEGAGLALQVCAGAGYLLPRLPGLRSSLRRLAHPQFVSSMGIFIALLPDFAGLWCRGRRGGPLHGLFPLWSLLTELWPRAERWPLCRFLDGSQGLSCSELLGGGPWPVGGALDGWYMPVFHLCLHLCLCH